MLPLRQGEAEPLADCPAWPTLLGSLPEVCLVNPD